MVDQTYQERVEALDPIAYWRLDEAEGATAVDGAGDLDGAYQNGAGLGAEGLADGGTAVRFDGVDDRVVIAHDDVLALDGGTISFWFQADRLGGRQGLLSKDSMGYDDGGHVGLWLEDDRLVFRMQSTTETHYLESGAGTVQAGATIHVAFSFGPNGARLYLNGAEVDADGYTDGLTGNDEPLVIGALAWLSGDGADDDLEAFFEAVIDEVAVSDQALSAEQVAARYDAGVGSLDELIARSRGVASPAVGIAGVVDGRQSTARHCLLAAPSSPGRVAVCQGQRSCRLRRFQP